MLESVLIANRGEIACRIIATARRLGLRTIAVYSDADRDARHVRLADEAVHIGGAAAGESYLRAGRLVEAARRSGAAAVHPGYGFLAENAAFARACEAAGLAFIGPPAAAIDAMGDKRHAKALMAEAGVPILPGYHGEAQDDAGLVTEAAAVGFPLLIKPSAGGGGKGMRVVNAPGELVDALAAARREAQAAFGDATLLLERYLESPRHVEVQVFADAHGGVVHLFERDCSVQRRHQKVVEEAPAPGLDVSLRSRMGEAAVAAARAISYRGAGTVEFLLEGDEFWFMEMNTRLQVEHPVTELVTGLDLVEWQLRVAAGEPLPCDQSALELHGHAVEVRLCAEDPAREFLPATGRLLHLRFPQGPGIRVDTGVVEGDTVSSHYDSLMAKLIAHGSDRGQALARLQRALQALEVVGVTTNAGLLSRVIDHEAFRAGGVSTRFLEHHPALLEGPTAVPERAVLLAALALHDHQREQTSVRARAAAEAHSPWVAADAWRLNKPGRERVEFVGDDAHWRVSLMQAGGGTLHLTLENLADQTTGTSQDTGVHEAALTTTADGRRAVILDGYRQPLGCHVAGDSVTIWLDGAAWTLQQRPMSREPDQVPEAGSLSSPLPGQVIAVKVAVGDAVGRGEVLMIVEAMKMEHSIRAPDDGTVGRINYGVGDPVAEGEPLLVIE